MSRTLDELDARLLNVLQEEVPLVDRPFAEVARRLGIAEEEVLTRITALKTSPHAIIRQISAIFDTKSLGYQSTLVAAKIEPHHLDEAVRIINAHPGVTHNYLRNHAYNLWYTLAVPPDSRLGLQPTLDILHRQSHAQATRMFPTLKLYKIGVSFDLSADTEVTTQSTLRGFSEEDRAQAPSTPLTDADKRMIRVLQQDLPLTPTPFDAWAEEAHVSPQELLSAARTYLAQHRMRRFSAVLHHRQAGFSANGMGIWAVPPAQQDAFGQLAASFAAVSHCYLRPTYEDWPYSIFTMVHAKSEPDCHTVLRAISQATGVTEYAALFSSKEFKKLRLRYFLGDIEAWETQQLV
ncbi:MAG: AsnC family transcriptional regulator [Bacillota bacterium]